MNALACLPHKDFPNRGLVLGRLSPVGSVSDETKPCMALVVEDALNSRASISVLTCE